MMRDSLLDDNRLSVGLPAAFFQCGKCRMFGTVSTKGSKQVTRLQYNASRPDVSSTIDHRLYLLTVESPATVLNRNTIKIGWPVFNNVPIATRLDERVDYRDICCKEGDKTPTTQRHRNAVSRCSVGIFAGFLKQVPIAWVMQTRLPCTAFPVTLHRSFTGTRITAHH